MNLLEGDVVEQLATLEPESIDAVVTDPPYSIEFLGHDWDRHATPAEYQRWCEEWGRALLRVVKPGAHMLAFGATRAVHRMTTGLEDAGWEIRDMLVWGYAEGMPKDGNAAYRVDREKCPLPSGHRTPSARLGPRDHHCARTEEGLVWDDWSTTLKPAWEPIVLARKPSGRSIAAGLLEHGVGALNIGATRIPVADDDPVNEREWVVADSAARPGTAGLITSNVAGDRLTTKPRDGGRWPATIVLTDPLFDGSGVDSYNRFFMVPKARSGDREPTVGVDVEGAQALPRKNTHPTVKPVDLMRHLVRLVTPTGGTVLDPFMGSGSTAIAAEQEGLSWMGIERDPGYVRLARARLVGRPRGLGL